MEELGPSSVAGQVKVFAGAIPAALEAVREERSWLSPLLVFQESTWRGKLQLVAKKSQLWLPESIPPGICFPNGGDSVLCCPCETQAGGREL